MGNEMEDGTRIIDVEVFAVLEDFQQVRGRTVDGHQYAITEKTVGLDWHTLREGQLLECTVTTSLLPMVQQARILVD